VSNPAKNFLLGKSNNKTAQKAHAALSFVPGFADGVRVANLVDKSSRGKAVSNREIAKTAGLAALNIAAPTIAGKAFAKLDNNLKHRSGYYGYNSRNRYMARNLRRFANVPINRPHTNPNLQYPLAYSRRTGT